MKTWQRYVTLLKLKDGDVPTTRNTLVNYLHQPLTHIALKVIHNAIQINLIPHKHHYLIYYQHKLWWILKFGYTASKIMINSSPSSCTLKLCVTPFSSESLTIYGLPITTSESSVGKMKNTTNGYIDAFLISTLVLGSATNINLTNHHASPG